jgi:hypothetical protein
MNEAFAPVVMAWARETGASLGDGPARPVDCAVANIRNCRNNEFWWRVYRGCTEFADGRGGVDLSDRGLRCTGRVGRYERGLAGDGPRGRCPQKAVTVSRPLCQLKAEFFKTLGHPVRIRVLELLNDRELAVSELLAVLEIEPANLSQQLAVLRRAGPGDPQERVRCALLAEPTHRCRR